MKYVYMIDNFILFQKNLTHKKRIQMQAQTKSPRRGSPGQKTRAVQKRSSVVSNGGTVTKTTTFTTTRYTTIMLDQREKDQLQLSLKEKEIELEHKLNTLIALNEKL